MYMQYVSGTAHRRRAVHLRMRVRGQPSCTYHHSLLTLGAHAPEGYSTYSLCVCVCVCVSVCLSVPRLLPSNRAYTTKWTYQHAFRRFFLVLNSRICLRCLRSRERALFKVIFVVSNPHKRLCILPVVSHV